MYKKICLSLTLKNSMQKYRLVIYKNKKIINILKYFSLVTHREIRFYKVKKK